MAYTVYLVTGPDGRHYVGCTSKTISERWRSHCAEARLGGTGRVFNMTSAISHFGREAFTIAEVATTECPHEAARLETSAISQFDAVFPSGYNVARVSTVKRKTHVFRDIIHINPKAKTNWPMSMWGT